MAFLNPKDAARFESLRQRCTELVKLRRDMAAKEGASGVDNFRSESLDRMLWLFLKLLHQRTGLEKFLGATRRESIEAELKSAEQQLATALERDQSSGLPESRLATSIRDRVTTIRERLDNHQQAAESLELVSAEIDKTEQQITHLCEVGMTMSDSAGLSTQIDSISASLQSSEKIFSQASFSQIYDDEPAPPLLSGLIAPPSPGSTRPNHLRLNPESRVEIPHLPVNNLYAKSPSNNHLTTKPCSAASPTSSVASSDSSFPASKNAIPRPC